MMNKIILFIILLLAINTANGVNVVNNSTYENNCAGADYTSDVYLNSDTMQMNPSDLMKSNELLYIRAGETEVDIWENTNGTLSNECFEGWDGTSGWARHSNVVPGDMNYVSVLNYFGNNCLVNKVKRDNNSLPSIQFVYKIAYKEEISLGTGTSDYYYFPFLNGSTQNKELLSNQTARVWSSNIKIHANECESFIFHFCGDGVLDSSDGEFCDDGNNIDGDGCSSTCNIEETEEPDCTSLTVNDTTGAYVCEGNSEVENYRIFVNGTQFSTNSTGIYDISNVGTYDFECLVDGETRPADLECSEEVIVTDQPEVCEAIVTGTQTSPISETTPDLCANTGETVVNFLATAAQDTVFYSWNCTDGVETYTGGNCNASYDTTTEEEVCSAGVTGTQSSPISETTPNLCANTGETVIDFIGSTSGRDTTYVWNCTDGVETYTGGNCNANYSSGGNGGGSAICLDIIDEGSDKYTCVGNSRSTDFGIDCDGDGNYEQISDVYDILNGVRNHTFTCLDAEITPRCAVENHYIAEGQSAGWNTSSACIINPYCGNGRIEPGEECERSINEDGTLGAWPNLCNPSTCKMNGGGGGGGGVTTTPFEDGNLITIPNEGEVNFSLDVEKIIGYYSSAFKPGYIVPFMENKSDYTLNFDAICLVKKTGTHLSGINNPICTPINYKFYPGTKIKLTQNLSDIKGKKLLLDSNDLADYYDNDLVLTIKIGSEYYTWSEILRDTGTVRVAKPAIQTTGGTSNNTTGSDSSNVANGVIDTEKNNNDVGVGSQSSSSNTTDDENVVKDADVYSDSTDIINTNEYSDDYDITDLSNISDKYNGLDNVFIIKNANITLGNTNLNLDEATTYIIDGGNLNINGNIYSNENIAFVLKNGGNINFGANVENVKGTYIVLGEGAINGDPSDKTLTINGSLYGDITNLVKNRYNVEENNGELTFGTIVSFGSSVFQKPAPLVTQFINTYLTSEKVAR